MSIKIFSSIKPSIGENVYIDETALVVGDVHIGNDCSIWPMTVVRGDVNKIRIGSRTNIQDGSILHVTHPNSSVPDGFSLFVGDNVTVGHKVILHGCIVEDNCLIGMGSTIMDGAIIHPYCLVGAGSLVSPGKEVEGGYLWLGSPVKKIRPLSDEEKSWIDYSAAHYINLKNRYLS